MQIKVHDVYEEQLEYALKTIDILNIVIRQRQGELTRQEALDALGAIDR